MPGNPALRNTTTRDRHRAVIRRGNPPCGICHADIDYRAPHLDPGEFVIDHIVPLARGGLDELENLQPAHRECNRRKSDKTIEELAAEAQQAGPRIFVTSRTW